LRTLGLDFNPIEDFGVLAGLTQLETLFSVVNNLNDLSLLAGLTRLRRLWLFGNNIESVTGLEHLPNLEELVLSDNQITDLELLVSNTGLGAGDAVHLTGNPLSDTALFVQIPALQARGVDVQFNAPDPGIGDVITVDLPGGATQEFVWIKPGGFLMGSPTSDQLRNPDEEPRHVITISREFWMGRLVRSRRSAVPLADRGGMGIRLPGGEQHGVQLR
jgi:hypothetical protein